MSLYSHRVLSDIFGLENIVQQTGIMHSKNILIDMIRDVFAQDRQYKYVSDVFGFPKTPSNLGLDSDAGMDDDECTRIFIGSAWRYDIKFNPSVIVRNTSSRYAPVSFNQNIYNVINSVEVITDGYGNQTKITTPSYSTIVGAWDQTFEVKVIAESSADREEIADILQVTLMGTRRLELQNAGVFIKSLSTSGESEVQYGNDYLYMVVFNLDVRTEWKVHIPISNVCEKIGLCLTFKTLSGATSDGLTINEDLTTADLL